jgi:hypothetical protein
VGNHQGSSSSSSRGSGEPDGLIIAAGDIIILLKALRCWHITQC